MTILNCKSHYTLLKSTNKPDDIVKRCNELGSEFAVLADQDSISGSVDFSSTLQKKGIKPIIGCEFSVIQDDKIYNQVLIAKNQEGWQNLLELSSRSYDDDRYIDSPSLTWDIIKEHSKGLIGYTGKYFNYLQVTGDKAGAINHAESLKESLDELFVSSDLSSNRDIAKQLNLKCINSSPGYYAKQDDARYQRLVLCTSMNATFNTVEKKMQLGEAIDNHQFFVSDKFFIDTLKEEELDNARYINSICDIIQLESKPRLPKFDCPNGLSEKDYLQDLAKIGLEYRGLTTEEYLKRLESELNVVNSYDVLNTYFLIVQDFVVWAKSQGWLIGPGRGCFTPDSRVKMSDGTFKPISLININDEVIDAFGQNQIVTDVLEYNIDEDILELEFENGKTIRCTKDHKFLTNNNGWVEAQYLTENDDIAEIQ